MIGSNKYPSFLSILAGDILAGSIKGAGAAAPTATRGVGIGELKRTGTGVYTMQLGSTTNGKAYGAVLLSFMAQGHPASNAGLTFCKVDPVPSTGLVTLRWFVQPLTVTAGALLTPVATDMTTGDFIDFIAVTSDSKNELTPRAG